MAVTFTCPECRKTLRVGDEYAGQDGQCPSCGTGFTIPHAPNAGAPPTAPAGPSGPWTGARPGFPQYGPPMYGYGYARADRGAAVLTLGILSWVVCVICGIIAWAMGSADLKEMQAGRMDPRGEGLTRAGMILGMIHVIIALAVLVVLLIAVLAGGIDIR